MSQENFEAGRIYPLTKTADFSGDAFYFFAAISDYGRKRNCIFLESADVIRKYGEKSIGATEPCLKVRGRKELFEIIALNELGERFLAFIKDDFGFADSVKCSKKIISGRLKPVRRIVSEDERLELKTHADVLRAVAFKFKPTEKPFVPYAGLFGVISYDFIDQFEDLPASRKDVLNEPDYELNFYDNLFLFDHKRKTVTFVANILAMSNTAEFEQQHAEKMLEEFASGLKKPVPKMKKAVKRKLRLSTDTSKKEFVKIVKELKVHILQGDVFQIVPSRTIAVEFSAEPLDVYKKLRNLNPSPYMFYFNNSAGILLGSSPEMFLKVEGNEAKKVEIRPIAGTKPRGFKDGIIDPDLDSRFEAELKLDEKELAEHTMLIDLARNDVARVSVPGTRHCDKPYLIEKYSHVQHLVSNVSGVMRNELDALHAYLASMNMGTLTGAPKVEAMKLLRLKEKTKRGFYGGSIGYLTPSGDFDSAIVIRSMSIKGGKAFVRAGAGIVFDSVPEKEFEETEGKARAAIMALELASGGKSGEEND
ncbi:MAG: anthranilate synthase component I [archaeon GW2011_AR10]|uniref:anthranilate synthase n=1 Tax=Candidatus Iainarchaeum sp. TaxID=3101447 RepID=A0A7J4ITG9_9ARCH|nr:MAG: anthranilate synthase component I [archaeon GW2011_AR10]HIH08818.1 anthranilate synthase component 1 [Candidatus Diapherotrites archaeon]